MLRGTIRGASAAGGRRVGGQQAVSTLQQAAGTARVRVGAPRCGVAPCAALGRRAALVGGAAVMAAATAAPGAPPAQAQPTGSPLVYEPDPRSGLPRVKYAREGWNYWTWRGHSVHYIEAGTANTGPTVVLVHGYGASAVHWRYQIPALEAAGFRVFAVCLLGFGYSEKARTDYSSGGLWADQLGDFVREVAGKRGSGSSNGNGNGASSSSGGSDDAPEPVILAGNSLGGYASLVAAARYPALVRGLALLNAAGPIKSPAEDDPASDGPLEGTAAAAAAAEAAAAAAPWWAPLGDAAGNAVKRVVLWFAFQRARQPERIREVLQMVYVNDASIDDDLVESIRVPATDPNAAEVFYRINATTRGGKGAPSVNALMRALRARQLPTLLLWGAKDPWITLSRAENMRALYPEASLVALDNAGHCPHDDAPKETAEALISWLRALPA